VTITTTPKTSPVQPIKDSTSPPPAKIAKGNSTNQRNQSPLQSSSSQVSGVNGASPHRLKEKDKHKDSKNASTTATHNNNTTPSTKDKVPGAPKSHSGSVKLEKELPIRNLRAAAGNTTNNNNNNNSNSSRVSRKLSCISPDKEDAEEEAPPAEYWLAKQPLADQIVITDVTVNLKTVTIRECKTSSGFFKERDDDSDSVQMNGNSSSGHNGSMHSGNDARMTSSGGIIIPMLGGSMRTTPIMHAMSPAGGL